MEEACKKYAKDPGSCYGIVLGVFIADSSFCTAGAGARNNNCGNVRPGSGKYGDPTVSWTVAPGNWRKYQTLEDGINDNVALYAQLYEGKSLEYMRIYWAGGSYNWKRIVQSYLAHRP